MDEYKFFKAEYVSERCFRGCFIRKRITRYDVLSNEYDLYEKK